MQRPFHRASGRKMAAGGSNAAKEAGARGACGSGPPRQGRVDPYWNQKAKGRHGGLEYQERYLETGHSLFVVNYKMVFLVFIIEDVDRGLVNTLGGCHGSPQTQRDTQQLQKKCKKRVEFVARKKGRAQQKLW
ncbi:hypothetical protein NDU88_001066 [Pleurodeles waltl]|uniref:Uncharacterized protein n=1 Tax=Pleurodeles waltl TaxID=8319 RepID=A0AAV7TI42_PLEWA|nr:hypothetical protein NDU88_001066 [Pleurodeles waltl]